MSTMRPVTYGPRSPTVHVVLRPFSRLVTVRTVPKGRVRWAQIPSVVSYQEPSPVWLFLGRVVVVVGFGRVVVVVLATVAFFAVVVVVLGQVVEVVTTWWVVEVVEGAVMTGISVSDASATVEGAVVGAVSAVLRPPPRSAR